MSTIDPRAVELVNQRVIPNLSESEKTIGILEMLNIASAIIELVSECPNLLQTLKKDEGRVLSWFHRPTFLNTARLYLKIRRQCKSQNAQASLHTIVNAILQAGQTATSQDVMTLCEAAGMPKSSD